MMTSSGTDDLENAWKHAQIGTTRTLSDGDQKAWMNAMQTLGKRYAGGGEHFLVAFLRATAFLAIALDYSE